MKNILVTGSAGQIGSELTMVLREKYGNDNVVAGINRTQPGPNLRDSGPYETVDCTDLKVVADVVKKYNIDTVMHLAAILSAVAEAKPNLAWDVNINGMYNVLEVARETKCAVFVPSSIGAFGPTTPL
ncbi:MAG: NAD-dependent epimerase/dehydratase family protein, partial [Candidatus Zixiibacteriota bacterium]